MRNYLLDSYLSCLLCSYLCKNIIFSNETSHAYQSWVGTENDIYDEVFADTLLE